MRALTIPWEVEELERRYRGAAAAAAARRYQALWLRPRGLPVGAAAAAVGVSAETLRAWVRRARAEGSTPWRPASPAPAPGRGSTPPGKRGC